MRHPIFLIAVAVIGMIALGLLYQSDDAAQAAYAAELDTHRIALEAELERREGDVGRLQERIASLEDYIAALNQVSEQAQARQAQLEADSALLVQRVIQLQVERDQFAAQAQTLAMENQRLTRQLAERPVAALQQDTAIQSAAAQPARAAAGNTPWWLLLGITGLPALLIGGLFIYFARIWTTR